VFSRQSTFANIGSFEFSCGSEDTMFEGLNWTDVAKERIAILAKYEPLQPFLLMELTKSIGAEVFLDIGANIGAYSIVMASLQGVKAVHAFEPTPSTCDELTANIGLNSNASKITVHQTALSDSKKSVTFGIVSEFSGANSIIGTSIHEADKFVSRFEVSCLPLDEVLTDQQKTISIKIDVEGHELQALAGARNFLTKNSALIQIENYNAADPSMSNTLTNYGYRMLFHVGPDQYFSNIPSLSESDIVAAFSKASSAMISENFPKETATIGRPIRVQAPFGIAVELSGPMMILARSARQALRRSKN
jgi:FkbM family methyltransferase